MSAFEEADSIEVVKNALVFLTSLIVLIGMFGCAAQSSHRYFYRASNALEKAKLKDPKNPSLKKAEAALAEGTAHLKKAKYDQAYQSFRESVRISDEIRGVAKAPASSQELPKVEVVKTPQEVPVESSKPENTSAKEAMEVSQVPADSSASNDKSSASAKGEEAAKPVAQVASVLNEPLGGTPSTVSKVPSSPNHEAVRSLPAEALARYLASKRSAKVEEPSKLKAQKLAEKIALAAPVEKSVNPVPPRSEISKTPSEVKTKSEAAPESAVEAGSLQPAVGASSNPVLAPTKSEELTDAVDAPVFQGEGAKDPVEKNQVVISDLTVSDKFPPATPRPYAPTPSNPEVVRAKEVPVLATLPKSKVEKSKTKIPGALRFDINETEIKPETMMNLDQTSKFLLDNPSTSLVFQGILGPGEAANLLDVRFESLRSYLVGKGVPEDQVRLDTKRRAAASAEFEMFLVEH